MLVTMPKTKLSKRTIDALKPRAERYTVWDPSISGFGIRITPNDQRVYVLKYRFGGTQNWFTIGKHGSPWTPDAARDRAKELLGDITKGINPAARRDADKQALTVSALCDLYLAEGAGHKKETTQRADRGRILRHLKPLLGRKRVERSPARTSNGFCATFNREKRPHPNRRKVTGDRAALRAAVRAWPRSASR